MYNYFGSLHAILWLIQASGKLPKENGFGSTSYFLAQNAHNCVIIAILSNGHKKSAHGPRVITVFALLNPM